MRTLVALALTAFAAAVVLVTALPAAAGGQEVIRGGSCSGSADWKLKLKLDNGQIEIEFEVDRNVNGERWRVVLKRDGNRFFKGVRTTHAPSGSFEVRRRLQDQSGPDRITARARNLESGELCRGAATI